MGIFSDCRLFAGPEDLLEERINENPYHPFQVLDIGTTADTDTAKSTVFIYSRRFYRFYVGLLMCVASVLFIIIWPISGGDKEYLLFGFCVLLFSAYVSVEYFSVRRLVLDPDTNHYSVYKGAMLIATEHCHNIYIRMLEKSPSSQSSYSYCLLLDCVGLEAPIKLANGTANKKKLRHLAHILTRNLSLNYFDVKDTSTHHIIRHCRPKSHSGRVEDHEV